MDILRLKLIFFIFEYLRCSTGLVQCHRVYKQAANSTPEVNEVNVSVLIRLSLQLTPNVSAKKKLLPYK